jgi:Ca2+-binding RTX toxin-like protein
LEDLDAAGRIFAADPDGDDLVYRIKDGAGPQLGTIIFGDDGHFVYRPNSNANGLDGFTIEVTDALSGAVEYTFNPVIAARNDNPVARTDTLGSVQGGTTKVISSAALLANDSDIDGDQLHVSAVSSAVGGTVSLAANGEIRFIAANNYAGAGSFVYTITDGNGGTAQAAASLTVLKNTTTNPHILIGTNNNDTLTGTNDADIFYGKNGDDVLNGRGGNDVFHVRGQAGLDIFNGGTGYDTICGGNSNDTIRVTATQSNLNSIEAIDGGAGHRDVIVATGGNDTLDFSNIAITGIEQIRLGAGSDTVLGSRGNDTFWGGTGQDTFRFQAGSGHDVILDFGLGHLGTGGDKIDLRGTGITSFLSIIENTRQAGHDTIIALDSQNSITLKNITIWHLSFEHFLI